MANNGQIEVDMNNPTTSLNVHEAYRRKVACGAVLSYELVTRESLKFPVLEEPAIIGIGEEAFLMSVKVKGRVDRTAPVHTYEQIGNYYEKVIGVLDKHQSSSLNNL
ncbi:MAG: hypothetical protein ABIB79_04895 [archaeon]